MGLILGMGAMLVGMGRGVEEGVIAFYSDRDGNPEIYTMRGDGSEQTRVTYHEGWDVGPALSPDGTRIAFLSSRDDRGGSPPEFAWEVYVMNVDGSDLRRLTHTPAGEDHLAWSPDGTRISFNSDGDGDGFQEIWIMEADGTGRTRLTRGAHNDQWASWSPDGQTLVFSSDRDGNLDLWCIRSDGSDPTPLTRDPRPEIFPEWSPAGDRIAFMVLEGAPRLWTVRADGEEARQLLPRRAEDPSWAPDGSALLFQDWDNGRMEIFRLTLDGGEVVNLSRHAANDFWPTWR